MTKQVLSREYVVVEKDDENEGEAISYTTTRAKAREVMKDIGGRRNGFKIIQTLVVQKEVR